MELFLIALSWLSGSDVDRLGHDDYRVRQAAQARLAWSWPLHLPSLLAAPGSENPELRVRAGRATATWHHLCAEGRAAAVLTCGLAADGPEFWNDHLLRKRVHRQAVAAGVPDYFAAKIHPDNEEAWGGWWLGDVFAWTQCTDAVRQAREHLGYGPPTP